MAEPDIYDAVAEFRDKNSEAKPIRCATGLDLDKAAADAAIKTAISAGLRKCVVEDGTPVPLIKDEDLVHITYMVWEEIAPLLK